MLSGSSDRKIVVYDLNLIKYDELTVHKGRINSIVYLSNKSYLVTSSYDTSIIYWKTVYSRAVTSENRKNSRVIISFWQIPIKRIEK